MSTTEYKSRHPLAWGIIAGLALIGLLGVAGMQGWLPLAEDDAAIQVCGECGTIEAVHAVETPIAAVDPDAAGADSVIDGSETEPVAQVSYVYEITVRYEDGTTAVFNQAEPPIWQAGDKVKIVDGMIVLSS